MHEVIVEAAAARELRKLPKEIAQRVAKELRGLAEQTRPSGCRKISGSEDAYRIRIGDYRILYRVDDQLRRVTVEAIGHRKDIYRH